MMKSLRGYFLIMGGATLWGISATLAKHLLSREIDTVLIVQSRASFSALVLFVALLVSRPALLRIRLPDAFRFAVLGICGVAGANFTYYFAIKETTVATAILIQHTAPLAVMFYASWKGLERVTGVKLGAAAVSLLGCFLALGAYHVPGLKITMPGLLSAFGAMITYAFLSVYSKHLLTVHNLWSMTTYSLLFASMFWLVVNPPWEIASAGIAGDVWADLVLLAIVSMLLPQTMFFAGIRLITPTRAVITATLEPVVAITSAAAFLGEFLEALQVVGAVLVLASLVLLQLNRGKKGVPATVQPDAA
ncbi:MAG: DMT family transporter [Ignavibacteria bacterium]|nr:DMT family transporter [Ignavibacteria bacterium]